MTKSEEKAKAKEMKQLYEELIALLLKRAGLSESDIYETAMKAWVSKNLDLLTPAEMKRFKGTVVLGWTQTVFSSIRTLSSGLGPESQPTRSACNTSIR